MSTIITILSIAAGIIVLLLIIALFAKKEHYAKRELTIHAPLQRVFDYLRLLKNQDEFNEGAMAGADRKKKFQGTDGTVGYIYAWSGDKDAGVGEKEIINIVEGESIEMEIRFVKPMAATARIIMEMTALSDNETLVSWSNAGTLKYPLNIMIPMLEKRVAKGMDKSLLRLKGILEQ